MKANRELNRDILMKGKEYELQMDADKRKTYGSFYTPDYIIDYIIKNTVANLDIVANPFVKILDPSCGSGFFLIKIYDVLMNKFTENINELRDKYSETKYIIETDVKISTLQGNEYWRKENLHYHILKNCIYGADIDYSAIELAKLALLSKGKNKFYGNINIVCCDSLIKWEEDYQWNNIIQDKSGEFVCKHRDLAGNIQYKILNEVQVETLIDVCKFWSNKFDYIIGNPPWVSLSRKYGKGLKNKFLDYYKNTYKGNLYLPNLYEYFIKRSFNLAKKGGTIGFIIPDRLAKNLQYKMFREEILKNYNILNMVFEIKFPNINTDTMIFIAKKEYRENNRIKLGIHNNRSYYINQSSYFENPNYEFTYENSDYYNLIKNKIEQKSSLLGEISVTFTGFIGNSKKITKFKMSNSQVEILKGENIGRYKIINNYYYEFLPENIKGGTKNIEKLACPLKILVRKTGDKIIAALDNSIYIVEQSLYGIIKLEKQYSYKYILGILNSKLIEWYYKNFLITNLNSIPQIKKYSLDKIPVKRCSFEIQKRIEELVDIIIEAEKCNVANDVNCKLAKNKSGIGIVSNIQNKLDEEIFKLYDIEDYEKNMILSQIL